VSTYAESGDSWQWLHGKVFAVELKEHPRILNLAHDHVAYDEYFTEPHASVNRDFTRVVFGSNWDIKSKTDVDTYLIEVPKNLTAPAPLGDASNPPVPSGDAPMPPVASGSSPTPPHP
jgi:hypothetical protein